ncbi:MAG TPA: response regulator [Kofleriaceae bacterium]|jgi:two-component system phosphate regulon response regulator PhoB
MTPPCVLVVDDDLDVRTSLAALLRARRFTVEVANNGLEAIDAIERLPPAAIVTDLLMPGLLGNELLEYIAMHDELAHVPIAIVTGSPRHAPPGIPLFRKPLDPEALVRFLRSATARTR